LSTGDVVLARVSPLLGPALATAAFSLVAVGVGSGVRSPSVRQTLTGVEKYSPLISSMRAK